MIASDTHILHSPSAGLVVLLSAWSAVADDETPLSGRVVHSPEQSAVVQVLKLRGRTVGFHNHRAAQRALCC